MVFLMDLLQRWDAVRWRIDRFLKRPRIRPYDRVFSDFGGDASSEDSFEEQRMIE